MLSKLLELAKADEPLWLPALRERFASAPAARPVVLRLTGHDGTRRDYPCPLPRWETDEERQLVSAYLYARIYNLLSACSGRELCLFFDQGDAELCALFESLDEVFQLSASTRRGYGKVISIAGRIAASYGGAAFRFSRADIEDYVPLPAASAPAATALDETLRALVGKTVGLCLCGVDVGGTDIKLAASDGDRLVCTKEYDWNPAAYQTAEELIRPILILTRLMRVCLAASRTSVPQQLRDALAEALEKNAGLTFILMVTETLEAFLGEKVDILDGVGVSFPDIVISDCILGGETPKTDGMRRNVSLDYEREFQKLSDLRAPLLALCRPGGRVRLTNDGNMAAFSAALELACSENAQAVYKGAVAHTLGTDLGTGWLQPDGQIPALPLEMYDMVLDLGSFRSRAYPPEDLRSTRNANSGLPGARRYMGQAAAYRLAWRLEPSLLDGFTAQEGELLTVPTAPLDLRKPCLEQLMGRAEDGNPAAREVFRRIGAHLGVVTKEMDFLLGPQTRTRFLFGRFVKRPAVFALLREGFEAEAPGFTLLPADDGLAKTPLMRALAAKPDVTVAQFGQAVGAVYYVLT